MLPTTNLSLMNTIETPLPALSPVPEVPETVSVPLPPSSPATPSAGLPAERRPSVLQMGARHLLSATHRRSVTDAEFWDGVRDLRETLAELRTLTRMLDIAGRESAGDFRQRELQTQRTRELADTARARVREAGAGLERLRAGLPLVDCMSKGMLGSEVRSRVTAQAALTRELAEASAALQGALLESEELQKTQLVRQLLVIDVYLDETKARSLVDAGGVAPLLSRLGAHPGSEVVAAYSAARSRNAAIESLAASVCELRQLMADLLVIIARQTTLIDSIEENVSLAKENTRRGVENVETAVDQQKRRRRRRLAIIIGICLAIGIFIVINMAASL